MATIIYAEDSNKDKPVPKPTPTAGIISTPLPTPVEPVNLAQGKTVTVSSVEKEELKGSNAVDGDIATRWGSEFSDPQWIAVDLGAKYVVNRIIFRWDEAFGKNYTIQVSDDTISWHVVKEIRGSMGGADDISISAAGRYVRMYGLDSGTSHGFSLREFEIYSY
ncbi:MAG: discoidin domain-containing protein [Spirochaetales bacterium]|nr:discoidin domain-containing protein [Spirochaetales bacterium]